LGRLFFVEGWRGRREELCEFALNEVKGFLAQKPAVVRRFVKWSNRLNRSICLKSKIAAGKPLPQYILFLLKSAIRDSQFFPHALCPMRFVFRPLPAARCSLSAVNWDLCY
jgi:hypothetical protein